MTLKNYNTKVYVNTFSIVAQLTYDSDMTEIWHSNMTQWYDKIVEGTLIWSYVEKNNNIRKTKYRKLLCVKEIGVDQKTLIQKRKRYITYFKHILPIKNEA